MKRNTAWVAIVMSVALAGLTSVRFFAQQTTSQSARDEVALRAAMEKETVQGDPKAAIEQYKKVAQSKDRSIAARALVRWAESLRKLGDEEAQKVYQRIVDEYGDQKDAVAIARAGLGSSNAVARSSSTRAIPLDTYAGFPGTVSADGRFLSYVNRKSGDVVLRDLKTGTDRVLSKNALGYNAISRDGKQVAFYRNLNSSRERELNIVKVQGAGNPEVRRLLALSYDNTGEIAPFDWSPDGRWLAVRLLTADGTKIGLVSVRDGVLRVLKTVAAWEGVPRNIFFSPDSRYIAYSVPVAETRNGSHVFVMAIDASRESVVVEHPSENIIMGWSPDGASLLFASDRNGSLKLWTLPVRDGQSHGTPTLVDTDIMGSNPVSLGVTAAGALYVWKFTRSIHIQVAPIDLNIGKLLMDPIDSFRDFVGSGGKPAWSPDGKYLAYRSCIGKCSRTTIKIRTMDTRQVRELQPVRLAYLQAQTDLTWSSDGRSLIVLATDLNGRRGNYRIDVQTGETSPVSGGAGPLENVTLDGTKMYVAVGGSIVEREASSGKERIVFQERAPGNRLLFSSSSDRRYTAIIETDSTRMSTLFVMPYGGGQPRELLRARALGEFGRNGMIWTLDNRAIVLMKANGQGKDLWLVPVIDGAPRKLDIDVGNWQVGDRNGGFKLRPDGRQIAFSAGEDKEEVWAIENFLPVPTARR